jgi:hypothetical protein
MTVRSSTIARSAAGLLGLSIAVSCIALGRPALAIIADKAKAYTCSGNNACLSASNADSTSGAAIEGVSSTLNGVQGNASGIAAGVFGSTNSNGFGVEGFVPFGNSDRSAAVLADGAASGTPLLLSSENPTSQSWLMEVYNYTSSYSFRTLAVDASGDAGLGGTLYTAGFCQMGCSSPRRRVASYGSRDMHAVLEDFGEARLLEGVATVQLDPQIAAAATRSGQYSVFVTAEGNTKGLYVSSRTRSGFTVREASNGRSTLSFAYRVVVQPPDAQPQFPSGSL